jgi:hypothetical protein
VPGPPGREHEQHAEKADYLGVDAYVVAQLAPGLLEGSGQQAAGGGRDLLQVVGEVGVPGRVAEPELQQFRVPGELGLQFGQAPQQAVHCGLRAGRVDAGLMGVQCGRGTEPAHRLAGQRGLAAEVPEHGDLVHPGGGGDVAGGDRAHAALGGQAQERPQDLIRRFLAAHQARLPRRRRRRWRP